MAADAEKLAAIGARIKQLRESLRDDKGRKLTQSDLGHAIHVSYRSVQNWEKGAGVDGIKAENIKALADYFRGRGLEQATEDYIEYGVVKRDRPPAPSPFTANGASGFATIRTQLARIEDMLAWLVLAEVGTTAQATGASEGEQLPGELGRDLSVDPPTPESRQQAQNHGEGEKRRDGTE